MKDGIIKNNLADDGGGGAVTVTGTANFIMEGGTIENNTAIQGGYPAEGGAVSIENGTFTMRGGLIRNNKASGTDLSWGGGVAMDRSSVFTMYDGTIESNHVSGTAPGDGGGGGVAVHGDTPLNERKGKFYMYGGIIQGNTVFGPRFGSGVYVGGDTGTTFTLYGNAVVHSSNEVYLADGRTITLDSSFNETGGAAAEIDFPSTFVVGIPVLSGTVNALRAGRFVLIPAGSIDADGKLQ
jgi:hypothetical protein